MPKEEKTPIENKKKDKKGKGKAKKGKAKKEKPKQIKKYSQDLTPDEINSLQGFNIKEGEAPNKIILNC